MSLAVVAYVARNVAVAKDLATGLLHLSFHIIVAAVLRFVGFFDRLNRGLDLGLRLRFGYFC